MKKGILLLLLLLFCAGVGKGLYFLKGGFSPRRIHPLNHRVSDNWNEEVNQALGQPFHYIGRGRQCFAFASQDGKYVLKLPRTDIYKTPFWARVLPVAEYREKLEADHCKMEAFILESFRLSFEELQSQTGLLALHLGQSDRKGKKLTLIDAMGYTHHLPLEKTSFVLQYKQPLLMKAFSSALAQGNRKEAEKILSALLDVIVERGKKGILNRDRSFLCNYGFDGKKAYQIDVGSFFRTECKDPFRKSVYDSIDPIQEYLSKIDPQMLEYFNQQLTTRI